jgi:ParB-like chromosome segregation protein Spo0J
MQTLKPTQAAVPQLVPAGQLRHLFPEDVKPSANNPRHLFDTAELLELKKNIAEHGVLVPITVYQPKGQTKFSILDGERRFRCVLELNKEGHLGKDRRPLTLPANVVEPPSKVAGLLYMFSIHNFREAWELMPTALSLKIVMEELQETENKALNKLTGLSETQIERCKKLLKFPERFQELSLDLNPATRIPSNFWIEALPVLDLAMAKIPVIQKLGRDPATDKLVEKYRAKKIKSVIHFRKIMEGFLKPALETRAAFDEFVVDKKRVQNALNACENFLSQLQQLKLTFTTDADERQNLRKALVQVREYCDSLEQALKGSDDPDISTD